MKMPRMIELNLYALLVNWFADSMTQMITNPFYLLHRTALHAINKHKTEPEPIQRSSVHPLDYFPPRFGKASVSLMLILAPVAAPRGPPRGAAPPRGAPPRVAPPRAPPRPPRGARSPPRFSRGTGASSANLNSSARVCFFSLDSFSFFALGAYSKETLDKAPRV
ncbi:hypothetical protein BC830DRAFT_837062 [Chytriomyces sp. MP71]|nr:hypothetical protein BC830DRAFT_837062 [Chytriomyces sp. MP71]